MHQFVAIEWNFSDTSFEELASATKNKKKEKMMKCKRGTKWRQTWINAHRILWNGDNQLDANKMEMLQ